MIIEQIFFWTGFVLLETILLFCIVFLVWKICMQISEHNKWYFYALWVVLYNYWKSKNKPPSTIMYWKDKKYQINEVE